MRQFDTTRADGQFRKPASNEKLLGLIGEFQFTPFEQGTFLCLVVVDGMCANVWGCLFVALDTTVKWFVENYDVARTGVNKK